MKKWEYMLVEFYSNIIKEINGQEPENYTHKFFGGAQGTKKIDFLIAAGKEGWEAISYNLHAGGGNGNTRSYEGTILFKRELEN